MVYREIDSVKLEAAQNALASYFTQAAENPGFPDEKAVAGATLLLFCLGLGREMQPEGERLSLRETAVERFRRVGMDEDTAQDYAMRITDFRLARFCSNAPAAEYINPAGSYGYRPHLLIEGANKFLKEA